jgi:predicted RNA-binding Zn-ribbon protein involved in translation (DUF1610 family)
VVWCSIPTKYISEGDHLKIVKKVKALICPQCGSTDVFYEAGLITGYKYHCKNCHYIGAFIIEKEMEISEDELK